MKREPRLTHEAHVEAAAYHEAGHAVIAWRHRQRVRAGGVWIDAKGYGGNCHVCSLVFPGEAVGMRGMGERFWRLYLARVTAQVEIDQAGWLAEYIHHGRGGLVSATQGL